MRLNGVIFAALAACLALATPAAAQQTGSISGRVTDSSGAILPGVSVVARADVLPGPRETVTGGDGEFQMPALPPGAYTLTFALSGMQTLTRKAFVQLAQTTVVNAELGIQAVSESVTVTAEAQYIDKTSAAITTGISNEQISNLPVGTQYRDLIKLIPGVQYSQNEVRGPSSGASGQDNVYNFDGVNVTLPLFGTLSAEPAAHDIAQVNVVKGGARAVDFQRAGGFAIDSVSKSGTGTFHGQASFRLQTQGMAAALTSGSASQYDQNRYWTDLNIGGPVIPEKMYLYGSYYRPERTRQNASTAYGDVPEYHSTRNEGFGKVTVTPTHSSLINLSYRDSHRLDTGAQFGAFTAGTAGTGAEAWQRIGTADASWIVNNANVLTFKYTHFENPTRGRPDNIATANASTTVGTQLDLNNLDQIGLLQVPRTGTNAAVNSFIQPIIDRYGYVANGVRTGGGLVGFGTQFDEDNFFRDAGQVGYNMVLSGMGVHHDIHAGYQQYVDSEDLKRSSNGWGLISVPAGDISFQGTPIYYQATFQSQGIGTLPKIHSEYHSKSFEINDTATWKNWTFNAGLLASNDTLLRSGPPERVGHAVRVRTGHGDHLRRAQVQDVQHPLQQDAPAAPERDLVVQRQGHRVRQLRALQPGGQFAAARSVVGPQPRRYAERGLRRDRPPVRGGHGGVLVGQALRAGHDAAPVQRVAVRHRAAVLAGVVGSRVLPLHARQPLLGGHEQHRAGGLRAAGHGARHRCQDPAGAVHSEPERHARTDRQVGRPVVERFELRDCRTRRRVHRLS